MQFSDLPFTSVRVKTSLRWKPFIKNNVFRLQVQFANQTVIHDHYTYDRFCTRLVLKQRHMVSRKWPIPNPWLNYCDFSFSCQQETRLNPVTKHAVKQ